MRRGGGLDAGEVVVGGAGHRCVWGGSWVRGGGKEAGHRGGSELDMGGGGELVIGEGGGELLCV